MTFDARSKERLEALGRTLPKKLPVPPPAVRSSTPPAETFGAVTGALAGRPQARELPQRLPAGAKRLPAEEPRHPLERAQDPADLFRALISASADGTVPPHLLDRLRELEQSRPAEPTASRVAAHPLVPRGSGSSAPTQGGKEPAAGKRRRDSRTLRPANADQDLYTAFAQLLLEDDAE